MSATTDSGRFFQSDSSIETTARRAKKRKELRDSGRPITLPTKILAIIADLKSPKHLFAAEAGNTARRIDIETNDTSETYRGHKAPVTCLALNLDGTVLYTGSWDKTVNAFSTNDQQLIRTFTGHGDFVKALQYIPSSTRNLLASASSDSSILIFNVETGERLYQLKSHARGVQTLTLDPLNSTARCAVLYSGDSRRDIKRFLIPFVPGEDAADVKTAVEDEVGSLPNLHETGVNHITFAGEPGEEDLWTASSDKTVKRVESASLPPVYLAKDQREVEAAKTLAGSTVKADTVLTHPDFVNDVVIDPTGRFAVTACSDEEVRVWDIASGNLYHTFEGHWDVVTSLVILPFEGQYHVFSASLDCTIRRWSLKDMKKSNVVNDAQKAGEKKTGSDKKKAAVTMTEEEERELAELMDDDD